MQVDRQCVILACELPRDLDVIRDPSEPPAARYDDQLVDMRIAFDDGSRVGLYDIREMGCGVVPPESAEERRREDHVADGAKPNEQDAH